MNFHPPQQARSQEKLDRLIMGMKIALQEKRFEHLTVIEIADRSSISPAWLYTRFKGKEELLEYLMMRHERDEALWAEKFFRVEKWESCLLEERWVALVDGLFDWAASTNGLLRNQIFSGSTLHQFSLILTPALSWLLECEDEINSPDSEAIIRASLTTLRGCIQSTAIIGENAPLLRELLKKNPPQ